VKKYFLVTLSDKIAERVSMGLVSKLHFFENVAPQKLLELEKDAKLKRYGASEILAYEEDDLQRVFFLMSGEVKFYKVDRFDNEVFLYTLKNEALITNIGSLHCDAISCYSNIEFIAPSEVLSLDLGLFKQIVKSDNALLINLVNLLAEQKQMMECTVNMGMIYDVTARVAKMLHDHLELYNGLKKTEVSYRLNIQPATLSRVLAKFLRKGVIEERNHQTVVLAPQELAKYFKEGV
jgi:CRP/FNR family transcriptional regulator